jgi:hypothetical protein
VGVAFLLHYASFDGGIIASFLLPVRHARLPRHPLRVVPNRPVQARCRPPIKPCQRRVRIGRSRGAGQLMTVICFIGLVHGSVAFRVGETLWVVRATGLPREMRALRNAEVWPPPGRTLAGRPHHGSEKPYLGLVDRRPRRAQRASGSNRGASPAAATREIRAANSRSMRTGKGELAKPRRPHIIRGGGGRIAGFSGGLPAVKRYDERCHERSLRRPGLARSKAEHASTRAIYYRTVKYPTRILCTESDNCSQPKIPESHNEPKRKMENNLWIVIALRSCGVRMAVVDDIPPLFHFTTRRVA